MRRAIQGRLRWLPAVAAGLVWGGPADAAQSAAGGAPEAAAAEGAPTRATAEGAPWRATPAGTTRRATPAGVRLRVEAAYTGEVFVPVRGAPAVDATYVDAVELVAHLELGRSVGAEGLAARLHLQSNHGETLSGRLGELQGASGLEAPAGARIYEAWLERELVAGRLALLAGVVDLNAEFDVLPAAGWLVHSSFGLGAELGLSADAGTSTYPSTSWGARLQARPGGELLLSAGVFDAVEGAPGGLVLLEGGLRLPRRQRDGGPDLIRRRSGRGRATRPVHSKLAAGVWAYTARQPAVEGGGRRRAWGAYALAEHRLLGGSGYGFGGVSAFARAGWARPAANRVAAYVGAGLAADGPLPGRRGDVLSLGVAHARNGDPFLRASAVAAPGAPPPHRAETAFEVTYVGRLGPVELQPDLQWIVHPGTVRGRANVVLAGLRLRASWAAP